MFKQRLCLIAVSAISLIWGLIIYIFMRSDTYIHDFLKLFFDISYHFQQNSVVTQFLKYYFVDFLWGLALPCALLSVSVDIKKKNIIAISILSFCLGVLFETAQLLSIVNGTFDFCDIGMYTAASLCFAVISIKNIKKE